jgi:hypothetical protein
MKQYSSANLLKEELDIVTDNDFFSKFLSKLTKTSTIHLKIEVPVNLYLRGEIICEDVSELSEMDFDQEDLMYLLFNDFLLFAKKNPDPVTIYQLLTSLEREAGKEAVLEKQSQGNIFNLTYKSSGNKMKTIQIRFRRKLALRGEVLLADLEEAQPEHGYTLEALLSLLYCDFVDKLRKGNNPEVINTIVSSITKK